MNTHTDAERATFDELAPQFLSALPQTASLPFALTYAAEGLRVGYAEMREQPIEKGELRRASVTCAHEFEFYGVTEEAFNALLQDLVGETESINLLLTERGHPDRVPEFFCCVARHAVERLVAQCNEEIDGLVDRLRKDVPTAGVTTDAQIAAAMVTQMVDDGLEYDSRQAFALAYETVVAVGTDPAQHASSRVDLSVLPQLLDAIGEEGFGKLQSFHAACLRRLYAAIGRPFPQDADSLLTAARDKAAARLYERALAEGTLQVGLFKPFDDEPVDGGFGDVPEVVVEVDLEVDVALATTPCPVCNNRDCSSEEIGQCRVCGGTGFRPDWDDFLRELLGRPQSVCEKCSQTGVCQTCGGSGLIASD